MDITFNCDQCGQSIVIDAAGAGLQVKCPKCGQSLIVPQAQPLPPKPPIDIPPVITKPPPVIAQATPTFRCKCGEQIVGNEDGTGIPSWCPKCHRAFGRRKLLRGHAAHNKSQLAQTKAEARAAHAEWLAKDGSMFGFGAGKGSAVPTIPASSFSRTVSASDSDAQIIRKIRRGVLKQLNFPRASELKVRVFRGANGQFDLSVKGPDDLVEMARTILGLPVGASTRIPDPIDDNEDEDSSVNGPDDSQIPARETWGNDQISTRQIAVLKHFQLATDRSMTKGQASDIIDKLFAVPANKQSWETAKSSKMASFKGTPLYEFILKTRDEYAEEVDDETLDEALGYIVDAPELIPKEGRSHEPIRDANGKLSRWVVDWVTSRVILRNPLCDTEPVRFRIDGREVICNPASLGDLYALRDKVNVQLWISEPHQVWEHLTREDIQRLVRTYEKAWLE